ncbi:MAG: energy transducer TonB [Chitinophagia bacterium]|nr:energy transducer TonB [Chitinophagia bacterium]
MKNTIAVLLLCFVLVAVPTSVFAQNFDEVPPPMRSIVDKMPKPKFDLNTYLTTSMKYPKVALEKKIEGRVLVNFSVNEQGKITDVRVIQSVGGGCDEEAMRVIKGMPAWTPGEKDGKKVKVNLTQPLDFKLK